MVEEETYTGHHVGMSDYLVHIYKRASEPFRSLSSLPDAEALHLMRELYIEGSMFWDGNVRTRSTQFRFANFGQNIALTDSLLCC